MKDDPFKVFRELLEQFVSHDGRLARRKAGYKETDWDLVCTLPTVPGRAIFTVGDLRALVAAGDRLAEYEKGRTP